MAASTMALPASGTSTWTVKIESCGDDMGCVQIGVCTGDDSGHRIAWTLMPYNGRLVRSTYAQRRLPGNEAAQQGALARASAALLGEPPLCNLPDGHDTQALVDRQGRPTNLHPVSYTHLTLPTICSV